MKELLTKSKRPLSKGPEQDSPKTSREGSVTSPSKSRQTKNTTHQPLSVLLLGVPGSGKTTALLSFEDALFINCDGDSIAEDKFDGTTFSASTYREAASYLCFLAGPQPRIEGFFSQNHHTFVSRKFGEQADYLAQHPVIMIDSLTALSKMCFDYAKELSTKNDTIDSRGTYFIYADQFGKVMKAIKSLSKTHLVVATAQLLEQSDDVTGATCYKAHLEGGKMSLDVFGLMDIVLTLTTSKDASGKPKRVFVSDFLNTRGLPAKDRTGKLDSEFSGGLADQLGIN